MIVYVLFEGNLQLVLVNIGKLNDIVVELWQLMNEQQGDVVVEIFIYGYVWLSMEMV